MTWTFEDLGFGDLSLTGLSGMASVWIPFQSDWVVEQPAEVNVFYIASPLLDEERATLTVLTSGGVPVSSIYPVSDGDEHSFSVVIPVELFREDGFTLAFEGHLAIPPVECPEASNPAQWMTILAESNMTITPTLNLTPPNLSDLPQAILVQNTVAMAEPPPAVFVLPDNPDETVLTTAAQVAARLGNGAGRELSSPFQAQTATTLTVQERRNANLVVVGLPENQPLIREMAGVLVVPLSGDGFWVDGGLANPEYAVIQIFNSPWNPARHILLVSAGNNTGLQLAGQAFADSATFDSLQTLQNPFGLVQDIVQPPAPESEQSLWDTPTVSFAQLGFSDLTITGTGVQDHHYTLQFPPGWVLGDGSQLTLRVASSPAMQSEASYVAVSINDELVGVVRTGRDHEMEESTFDLPVWSSRIQQQTIVLQFSVVNYLMAPDVCVSYPEAPWTTIYSDSTFVLSHGYHDLPDLQAFPYPFVSDRPDAPVTIVVPPQPDPRELGAALSLAASLGRFAPTDFVLSMLSADQASQETQGDAHLIIMGTQTRQPFIEEFVAGMEPIPEDLLAKALESPDSGLFQEDISPWNPDRVALLVYGESDAGFENAAGALFNAAPPITEPGSAAVVLAGQSPRAIFLAAVGLSGAGMPEGPGTPSASPPPQEESAEGQPDLATQSAEGAGAQPGGWPRAALAVVVVLGVVAIVFLGLLWLIRRRGTGGDDPVIARNVEEDDDWWEASR